MNKRLYLSFYQAINYRNSLLKFINFKNLPPIKINKEKMNKYFFMKKTSSINKNINLLFLIKNNKLINSTPQDFIVFNHWKFYLKKTLKIDKLNKEILSKRLIKFISLKKKTYKQRWWEEQLFLNERRRKNLPIWFNKQLWLQYWYNYNVLTFSNKFTEMKFQTNILFKFNMFLRFFSIFFKFNNIFVFTRTFFFFKLMVLLQINFTANTYVLIFSRFAFNFWDKYKLLGWKDFKWNILFFKKLNKNFVFQIYLILTNVINIEQKSNNLNKKELLLIHLIKYKKSHSCFKQNLNLPKYTAHVFNLFNKLNYTINVNLLNFSKLYSKAKSLKYHTHLYKFNKLLQLNDNSVNSLKFVHLNTKWFNLYQINRKIFKFFFFLKNKKQYFLTKFISTLVKKSNFFFFNKLELNILTILLKSKLALSYQHAKDLLMLGYVYINAIQSKNNLQLLKPNDYIQLVFDDNYLLNYQYLYLRLKQKQKHIKYCFQRWYNNRFDFYKQHTKRFPNWLLKLMFFKFDVPLYLEVDYSILTIIILRNPIFFYELNMYLYKYVNTYLIKLYNWKYIT